MSGQVNESDGLLVAQLVSWRNIPISLINLQKGE